MNDDELRKMQTLHRDMEEINTSLKNIDHGLRYLSLIVTIGIITLTTVIVALGV